MVSSGQVRCKVSCQMRCRVVRSGASVMSTVVQSDQVKSSQVQGVMSNEVQSGQVNPDQVQGVMSSEVQGLMSSEVQSGQVRSGQVR